jgi:hypothetical protein
MTMVQEIKDVIHAAAHERQKDAMFHFQILKHVLDLEGVDATTFCRNINVPDAYR